MQPIFLYLQSRMTECSQLRLKRITGIKAGNVTNVSLNKFKITQCSQNVLQCYIAGGPDLIKGKLMTQYAN